MRPLTQIPAGALDRARQAVGLDRVRYKGVMLPPPRRRRCGPRFQDDETFLTSAHVEAERLERDFGLTRSGSVLDVGCGVGRLAIGLRSRLGEVAAYRGIDVDRRDIEWCSRYIGRRHPSFKFTHVDAANARYNPSGEVLGPESSLPFSAGSFDVIYSNSVLSHMETGDVRIYLREFARLLHDGGGAFVTAFVEDDVPEISVNPAGYLADWSGPLHCVRYERSHFEAMVGDAGLRIERFEHRAVGGRQSALYLSKHG